MWDDLEKIKTDPSCLTAVKESAHGLNCSFISLIKSENRRKGKVGQKLPDSFRIKTFSRRQDVWKAQKESICHSRKMWKESQDTLNSKNCLQENETHRTGHGLQRKGFESENTFIHGPSLEIHSRRAAYTQAIQNRFYYGTNQVFQSQLLIT